MSKFTDLVGKNFGYLTVLKKTNKKCATSIIWLCKCRCGNLIEVPTSRLKSGNTKSCGCLRYEKLKKANTKHGLTDTRIYNIWKGIKRRCNNPKCKGYKYYGAKGIKICDRWNNNFIEFYNWALKNGYNDTLTIDRIDNNGNYEPNNCRWATYKEQTNNMTTNHILEYNNRKLTISQWAETTGVKERTIRSRVIMGWDVKRILETH